MVNPVPGHSISTPFGRRGQHWSCQKDSSGRGIHTGADWAAPQGTPIVAPIDGQIRHRNYGAAFGRHQFAISPDPGQPFADGEVFFAHTIDRPADGAYVKAGQQVARVGADGNATGPHLHMEYMPSTKGVWRCGIHADPAPVVNHGGGPQPDTSTGGPYVTADIYSDKLGFGQMDSDSVKELQERLNRIKLVGGTNLPVTGNYLEQTDSETRKWQEQIVHDPADPAGKSFLGPAQRAAMFPSPPYTIHDRGLPAIASGGGGGGGGGDVAPPPVPPVVDDKPAAPSLLIPGAIWDPIRKKDGGWFTGLRPFKGAAKKITLHTTETDEFPNWVAQQSGIPHLTVDLDGNETRQHLPFDIAAYTLKGGDYSPNSDAGVNIQIEIVGRAAQSHDWGVVAYARLKSLLLWLCDTLDIPYEFPWTFGPAGSSHRVDWPQWERVSGILGHLHAPWNDHWDPGDLDVSRLASSGGQEPEEPPAPTGDYVTRDEYRADLGAIADAIRDAGDP